ncbi:MAG: Uncharacterised protein [Candidatus Poseidoniaceae archaeon]|nr:MAG: Uncharacterised protein [Candidatus Poseidoniaceae archaeon]
MTCGVLDFGGRSWSISVVAWLFEVTLSPLVESSTPKTVFQPLEGRAFVSNVV